MNLKIPISIKSSKRYHFNKHKKTKKAYASKKEAYAFIKHANDNTLEAYWCNYCCHWHVGHNKHATA